MEELNTQVLDQELHQPANVAIMIDKSTQLKDWPIRKGARMADTTTMNIRMETETKEAFTEFCSTIGMSASSLMNVFAKVVVREQRVPFELTTIPYDERYARIFPRSEEELLDMLEEASKEPLSECIPQDEAVQALKEYINGAR